MFFSSVKTLLASLALSATFLPDIEAAQCGKWYTSECLGDKDKRYDPSSTNDIVGQDSLWGEQAGYWVAVYKSFDANDNPIQPTLFDPTNLATGIGLPYTRDINVVYANITVSGSRMYEHRYSIFPPADQAWCDANPSIGPAQNSLDGGVCGVNGYASWVEIFYTSSFEKDGSINSLGGSLSFSSDTSFQPVDAGMGTTIGRDTIFTSSAASNNGGTTATSKVWTFTNKAKTTADAQGTQYNTVGDVSVLVGSIKLQYTKISEEEFIQGLQNEWKAQNVQEDNKGDIPLQRSCLGSACPTEEEWCKIDPECAESPYVEPDADVRTEVIVGFVVAGVVLLVGALYLMHRRILKAQKKRIRKAFVQRIASGINVGISQEQLTMEGLQAEFLKIDTSHDGLIQKEELREFIMSGKVGSIDEKDFETLFAAFDSDGSGNVDFAEFASYINQCDRQVDGVTTKEVPMTNSV